MDRLVGFFSYKGGVGRTLILCSTALALLQQLRDKNNADHGVFCVDLDLSAPGLLPVFGVNARTPGLLEVTLRGEMLGRSLRDHAVQLNVSDRKIPIRILAEQEPHRGALSALTILFSEEADPDGVRSILLYLKERGRKDFLAPYTLLDLGAGLGQLPLETFATLDHLVLVIRGDRQHRLALPAFLKNIRRNYLERNLLPYVHVVLNQVPGNWIADETTPDKVSFLEETGLKDFLEEKTGQSKSLDIVPLVEHCLTRETVFFPEHWNYSEQNSEVMRLPTNDAETR